MEGYNNGEVYIAPSINNLSLNHGISLQGACNRRESGATFKTVNAAGVTLDFGRYDFSLTDKDGTYNDYSINGVGEGYYGENYGILRFIPSRTGDMRQAKLRIAAITSYSSYGMGSWYFTGCRNYADIFVDFSGSQSVFSYVSLYGIGNVGGRDCINYGDIKAINNGSSMTIYTLCGDLGEDLINFGNVECYSTSSSSSLTVEGTYIYDSGHISGGNILLGWYDGCEIPERFRSDEYSSVFALLDPSRTYGNVKISGSYDKAEIIMCNTKDKDTAYKDLHIINNGSISAKELIINRSLNIYALSNGRTRNAKNYGNIDVRNVVFSGGSVSMINAGASGDHNINYGNINVSNCVSSRNDCPLYINGMCHSTNYSSSYLENHGSITVSDFRSATVGETVYNTRAANGEGLIPYISGISYNQPLTNCINYGRLSVERVPRSFSLCGIGSGFNVDKCVNYGDLFSSECDACYMSNVGGIASAGVITNCCNFGKLTVLNPTGYYRYNYLYSGMYIGGIAGTATSIYNCANYGDIYYNNSNEIQYTYQNMSNTTISRIMHVGGVLGSGSDFSNVLNYGRITVEREPHLTTCIGGIVGYTSPISKRCCNMINYGDIIAPEYHYTGSVSPNGSDGIRNGMFAGGIIGYYCCNTSAAPIRYGINYGSLRLNGTASDRTGLGSLIGGEIRGVEYNGSTAFYDFSGFVDLMKYEPSQEHYPLSGYSVRRNAEGNVNYTMYADVAESTPLLGQVKVVTVDDTNNGADNNAATQGLYYPEFLFRQKLVHEKSEQTLNGDIGLVYQELDKLSPYLQAFMKNRFGNDICGAYVMLANNNSELSTESRVRKNDVYLPENFLTDGAIDFGVENHLNDSTVMNQSALSDSIYHEACPVRTMQSDLTYLASQLSESSLAEVYRSSMKTKYCYRNTESGDYSVFTDHVSVIESAPARNDSYPAQDENKVEKNAGGDIVSNPRVLYTDIYFYMDIDPLDTSTVYLDAEGTPAEADPGYLYLNLELNELSARSSMVYYNGAENDLVTPAGEDPDYSSVWCKSYNVEELLSDGSLWTGNGDEWSIKVPFDRNNAQASVKKTYTKVYGIQTAEDGIHRNIIRANVVLDSFRPSALLESASLYARKTTQNGTTVSQLISTAETSLTSAVYSRTKPEDKVEQFEELKSIGMNNGMTLVRNQPSLTDTDNGGQPLMDVNYYYLSDNIISTEGQDVSSFLRNTQADSGGFVKLLISTENMTDQSGTQSNIWAEVSWQDRIPGVEGKNYNQWSEINWNDSLDLSDCETASPGGGRNMKKLSYASLKNIVDPVSMKTTGYAEVQINDQYSPDNQYFGGMYYGGLYRVDLYYERTKDAGEDSKKHFASVFFWKDHSEYNENYYYHHDSYYDPDREVDWICSGYDNVNGHNYRICSNYTDPETGLQYGNAVGIQDRYNFMSLNGTYNERNYTVTRFSFPFWSRSSNDRKTNRYSKKAYSANRGVVIDPDTNETHIEYGNYQANTDSTDPDSVAHLESRVNLDRIDVYRDETGMCFPASLHWSGEIISEDLQHVRSCEYEYALYGYYMLHSGVDSGTVKIVEPLSGNNGNAPRIYVSGVTQDNISMQHQDGRLIIAKDKKTSAYSCTWRTSNVDNIIREGSRRGIYADDGFSNDRVKIYFKPHGTLDYVDITDDRDDYFESFTSSSSSLNRDYSTCNFRLRQEAPTGSYKIVPYIIYTTDLRNTSDNPIRIIEYNDNPELETNDISDEFPTDGIYHWTIMYEPFYLESEPLAQAYLTEFDVNNDNSTPHIEEDEESTAYPADDREVYIVPSSPEQRISYEGYESYLEGNNRADRFTITAYTAKDDDTSELRMKLSPLARLMTWTGEGEPFETDGSLKAEGWEEIGFDSEGTTDSTLRQYKLTVHYNEETNGEHSGLPSRTYYKAVAENGTTSTLYTVNVIPGVRNKTVESMEIATDASELDPSIRDELEASFNESALIYDEITARYGQLDAHVKELGNGNVQYSVTKWFSGRDTNNTVPLVYNLKAHQYDISIDLPVGYTYDVIIMGGGKNNYQILKPTGNGFSGKHLILNHPDAQTLLVRFVLRRVDSPHWGVNYCWTPDNANLYTVNGKHYVNTIGGGKFYVPII